MGPDGTAELGLEEFRALARAEGLVLENAEELLGVEVRGGEAFGFLFLWDTVPFFFLAE